MRFLDEEAANVKRTIERLYDEMRSQNQALQERLDRQEVYISKEIPALRQRAEKAERETSEAFSYIGRPRNAPSYTALQERADHLEMLLRQLLTWSVIPETGAGAVWRRTIEDVLSPIQETDPPFVGTLDETIAYLKEPTQETDSDAIGEPGVDWVDADHPCKRCGQIMPHTHDLRPTQETDPE
jgi:hypothetical protein